MHACIHRTNSVLNSLANAFLSIESHTHSLTHSLTDLHFHPFFPNVGFVSCKTATTPSPYVGNSSVPCSADTAPRAGAQLHSWGRVYDDDRTGDSILSTLETHGPVGLGVDARCFHGYQSGIVRECAERNGLGYGSGRGGKPREKKSMVNHGDPRDVVFPAAVEFFTIKNSWGSKWGEDGYVRIERGKDWWGKIGVIYTE
jgi:hypothetical protein